MVVIYEGSRILKKSASAQTVTRKTRGMLDLKFEVPKTSNFESRTLASLAHFLSRAAILWARVWMEKQITMVTLDQVSKVYERGGDTITGLDRVSVEVAKGDFCAFIGPSGCGKSTLLNLVGGLDVQTSGDILLGGQSTSRFTSDDWTRIRRETVGIVFQAFHLIPGLTAAENVAFPLLLRGERGASVQARVEDVLELV